MVNGDNNHRYRERAEKVTEHVLTRMASRMAMVLGVPILLLILGLAFDKFDTVVTAVTKMETRSDDFMKQHVPWKQKVEIKLDDHGQRISTIEGKMQGPAP